MSHFPVSGQKCKQTFRWLLWWSDSTKNRFLRCTTLLIWNWHRVHLDVYCIIYCKWSRTLFSHSLVAPPRQIDANHQLLSAVIDIVGNAITYNWSVTVEKQGDRPLFHVMFEFLKPRSIFGLVSYSRIPPLRCQVKTSRIVIGTILNVIRPILLFW